MYARAVAGLAGGFLFLYGCVKFYHWASREGAQAISLGGMAVPPAALWAAGLFIVLAAVALIFTYGVTTGVAGLDRLSTGLIDTLIDTEAELAKVAWPDRDELTRSTVAVLVAVFALGMGLYAVDQLWVLVMVTLKVLPK